MESTRAKLDWFKQYILPHEGALRARLRRVLPAGHDCDDLVSETLIRAFTTKDFERITHGRSYLFQIVRNLLIDEARRAKIVSFEFLADLDLLQVDDSAERVLQARDELRRLQAIIDTLPTQCRRAFILRRVMGKSVGEIAEEMGLSVSTVDKHLAKAAVRVMQAVAQFGDSGFERSLQEPGGSAGDRSRGRSPVSQGER